MPSNKLAVYIHFVWSTWDRLPLIEEVIERPLFRYIGGLSKENGCEPAVIGGTENHIHLFVEMASTISIADLARRIKSGSSRYVSETIKPGEWFAWQASYGAFSVSPRDRKTIIDYINKQKEHHASGKVWPSMELPVDSSSAKADEWLEAQ
jgi:REP element-mobilizing transposase RayT